MEVVLSGMQAAPDVLKLDLVAMIMAHHLLLLAALLLLGSRPVEVEVEVLALVLLLGYSVVLLATTEVVIPDLGLIVVAVTAVIVVVVVTAVVAIAMEAIVTVVTNLVEVHLGLVTVEAVHLGHNKTTTLTVANKVVTAMVVAMVRALGMISRVATEDTILALLLNHGLKLLPHLL